MTGNIGHAAAVLGLLASVAGAGTLLAGLLGKRPALLRQSPVYVVLLLAAAVIATAAMEYALLTHDFSLKYVAQNHSLSTPTLFTVASMWAALEGSILLWCLVLAGFTAAMLWRFRSRREDSMVGWAMFVVLVVCTYFFALLAFPANPFTAVDGPVPVDGPGPNPLLQNHPLMAVHPPMLYLGYVGFTVPFAFGMAALITGRLGEGWLVETRRWALAAWTFLTAGIVLGSWWSYEVLGWGGYWAWDPVENASLLPWLTATAYLHSVMVQERRGMLRVWNLTLLAATFALTILGTFFTRSGVLDSVHAFTESPLGPWLLSAFGVVVVATCGLMFWRSSLLGSPGSISSAVSREAAFLGNNLAFAAFAFVVLLGTSFPLLAEAFTGDRLSIGRPFFDTMIRPVGLVLLFLMAVAPALPWRGENTIAARDRLLTPAAVSVAATLVAVLMGARGIWVLVGVALTVFSAASAVRTIVTNVRRGGVVAFLGRSSGGMVAHIGVAVMALAIVASGSAQQRGEVALRAGESGEVAGHNITFEGLNALQHSNRVSTTASVRIDGGKVYEPALSIYPNATDAVGTPSVRTTLREDVYLTLVRVPERAGDPVVIGVIVNPGTVWLWIGGAVTALGSLMALVRQPGRREYQTVVDSKEKVEA